MTPRLLHPFAPPTKSDFIRLVRGKGASVWDDTGKEYIDGIGALWFANLGYGNEEVVAAMAEQASTLHAYHLFDPFTSGPAEKLADRIAGIAPIDDPRVFLTGSGSESIDSAIKLARSSHVQAGRPERQIIVTRSEGYHGTNLGGTSAQGIELNRAGWGDLAPNFIQVPGSDIEAMSRVFSEHGDRIAAVISEPIQGAGGVIPPPPGYLAGLRRLCDEHGAYLISDEVICGFGRVGHWFGTEFYDVRPDMITFAKAVTSGYQPLGGVIVGAPVRDGLEADPEFFLRHGYTYSGHATAAAAALTCIDIYERDGLLERATAAGERLSAGLKSLVDDGLYRGLRGEGFIWALECDDPKPTRDRILDNGTIVRPLADALAFCPPLVITDDQIDRMVDACAAGARP